MLEREWSSVLVFPLDVDVFWGRTTPPVPIGHDGPKSADG